MYVRATLQFEFVQVYFPIIWNISVDQCNRFHFKNLNNNWQFVAKVSSRCSFLISIALFPSKMEIWARYGPNRITENWKIISKILRLLYDDFTLWKWFQTVQKINLCILFITITCVKWPLIVQLIVVWIFLISRKLESFLRGGLNYFLCNNLICTCNLLYTC